MKRTRQLLILLVGHREELTRISDALAQRREVGDEDAKRVDLVDDMVEDSAGDRQAVVGACAPTQLIEDHERTRGRSLEDCRRLAQFDHECRATARQLVRRAHASIYAITETRLEGLGGDVAADLGGLESLSRYIEMRRT